jgi:uncharacterized repeat protein (TIGR02543 family)
MLFAAKMATFRRVAHRALHHFLALVVAISTLSAISAISAPDASAAQGSECVIGSSSSCPATSPQEIYNLYGSSSDGTYWLRINNEAKQTYLIMNTSAPDGGMWFLGMKAPKGSTTFKNDSTYWTSQSSTIGTSSLINDVSTDAKFDAFNYLPTKKVVAVFRDRDSFPFNTSGSGDLGANSFFPGHTWMETLTTEQTMFTRFTTTQHIVNQSGGQSSYQTRNLLLRETNLPSGKLVFPYQTGWSRYGFNNTDSYIYRWGVTFNNETSNGSNDTGSGIGMADYSASAQVSYSDNFTVGPSASTTSGVSNPGTFIYPSGFQIWGKTSDPSLAAPASLTSTIPAAGQVNLSWSALSGATDYVVQYKSAAASSYANSFVVSGQTTASITGLSSSTSYNFRVFARTANNSTSSANITSSTITATPRTVPGAPTSLSTTVGSGQVGLTWTAPNNDGGSAITDYVVQSSTDGTSFTTFSDGTSTATTATVTGLNNGTAYTFRVAAVNAAGTGTTSSTASGRPLAICSPATTSSGGYTYVAIKTVGTCSWTPDVGVTAIDLLVVAGGGGGATRHSGGGGAGGLINATGVAVNGSALTISVGAGGAGGAAGAVNNGSNGGASTVSGGGIEARNAIGGGGGGSDNRAGSVGGSGGGGGSLGAGGLGTSGQGRNGSAGSTNNSSFWVGGGGGGAGGEGALASSGGAGSGGAGVEISWIPTSVGLTLGVGTSGTNGGAFAGGGGGGSAQEGIPGGVGGTGGGGAGSRNQSIPVSGTDNTGGGGGGAGVSTTFTLKGGDGGSGVVVVRYANVVNFSYDLNTATSGSVPTNGSGQGGVAFTTAASTGIAKTNYNFGGWCTTQPSAGASCSGTLLTAGVSQTMPVSATSLTFYAVWTGSSQTISYANGGGTGTAPSSPTTVAFGATFTTPANTYTRNGFYFSGWSDGTNTYSAGVPYPATGTVSGNVSLTAQWTSCGSGVVQTGLLVHLDAGNTCSTTGSTTSWKDISSNGNNATLQNTPTYEGTLRGKYYSFGSGGTASTTTTGQHATLASGVSDFSNGMTLSFFASFSASAPSNETVFSIGSNPGSSTNEITFYRTSTSRTLSVYTSEWNGNCTSSNTYILNGSFAHYAITWTPNGDCKFYRNGVLDRLSTPSRNNVFTNISRPHIYIGRAIAGSISYFGGSIGDIAFYNASISASDVVTNYLAQVDATYTVTYIGNGNSTGSVPSDSSSPYVNGSSVTALANSGTLAKTGYTFNGWCSAQASAGATCASVSGTSYTAGSGTFTIGTSNVTLYALWTASAVTIATPSTGLSGTINSSYTLSISVSGGTGTGTYSLPTGSLPSGVTLNTSTGEISGTPTAAGTFAITVRFTDASGAIATTSSFSIVIAKLTQTITFSALNNRTLGSGTYAVSASSSSSLTVSFTSATVSICTISSGTITLVAAGTCTINADQTGNSTYSAATQVQRSFTVATTLTITTPTTGLSGTYNSAYSLTITASGGSGSKTFAATGSLPTGVTISSEGVISGTPSTAGDFDLTVTATDANSATATTSSFRISIAKGVSTISISVPSYTYTGSPQGPDSVTKSGSSGSVTYAYEGRLSTTYASSGTKPTASGTYKVTATVAADSNFASVSTTADFQISNASLFITPTISASSMAYGTSGGSLPTISHSKNPDISLTTNPTCALYLATDTSFVTAQTLSSTLAVGSYVVRCAGAVQANYTITYGTNPTFSVTKANQTAISLPVLSASSKTFPFSQTSLSVTSVTGGDGNGALSISSVANGTATGCSLSGSTLTATSSGTCTLTITKAASANFEAATTTATFTFNQATQSVSITSTAPTAAKVAGSTYSLTATGGPSGNSVTFTSTTTSVCTVATATVSFVAVGTCSIAANQASTTNYSAATEATQSFLVGKGDPALSSFSNVNKIFGDSAFTLTAPTVANSMAGAFTYASGTVGTATISGATLTIVSAGTSVVTATFTPTDNTNYNTATISMTLTVSRLYSFSYDGNQSDGGSTPAATSSIAADTTVTVASNLSGFTRTGFTFVAWNTAADGSGTQYVASNTFTMPSADRTLYAQWTRIKTSGLVVNLDTTNPQSLAPDPSTSKTWVNALPGSSVSSQTGSGVTRTTSNGLTTLNFDGNTDYFQYTNVADTRISSAMTVEMWINPSSLTNGWNILATRWFTNAGAAADQDWHFAIYPSGGSFKLNLYTTGKSNVFGDYAFTTNKWYLVGFTINSSGSLQFYVNGQTDGSAITGATHNPGANNNNQLWIGEGRANTGGFIGGISKFRLYSNALTSAEMLANYDAEYSTYSQQKITFNSNYGATPTTSAQYLYKSTSTALTANSFTRAGYTFAGWNTEAIGSGTPYANSASITLTNDTNLFAQWTANSQTITYAAGTGGSGSGPTTPTAVTYGGTFTTPANTFTRTGFTFAGWSDGTSVFQAGVTYPTTGSVSANVTLTATWTADTNVVVFDNNTGSGTMTSQNIVSGTATSLTSNTFTKTGYTFAGWNTNANGTSGTNYTNGQSVTITAGMTLYAKWSANALTVTYDSQGGTAVSNGTVNTGANISTAPTAPTKTGYTLTGWSTTTTGSVVTFPYTHGQTANFTLYAIWADIAATVYFHADDYTAGSTTWTERISNAAGTTATGGMTKGTSPISVVFAGKESSNSDRFTGSIGSTTGLSAVTVEMWIRLDDNGSTQNATGSMLFAWSANAGTANYNIYHQGGKLGFNTFASELYGINSSTHEQKWRHLVFVMSTGAVTTQKIYVNGVLQTLSYQLGSAMGTRAFNSSGSFVAMDNPYSANTWNAKGNLGLLRVYKGELIASQAASLYDATKSTYEFLTVTYDSQGGTSVSAASTAVGGSISSAPTPPTRAGYTFSGWSTTSSGSAISFTGGYTHGQSADFTLYAIWTPDALTITYDSKSGSSVANGSVNAGASISAAPTAPTRTGYTLSGWSATDGGTVVTFPFAHGKTANFTMYAIWSANALTITYDSKSGTTVSNGTVNTGASISAAPTAPTRAGYTLSGWSATDGGTVVTFPYAHGETANFTLYAIWTANSLTVTYNSKGGTAVSSGTVNTAASISSAPTAPTRTGYTFSAWSATDGGTAITFPYAHGQTANFTLFALWTAGSLVVTYDAKGGSSVSNGSTSSGASISTAPTAPTRTGYTLDGWSATETGTVVVFPYAHGQTANFTLYAKWTGTTNTITYDSKSGTSVANGSFVTGGSIASAPTAPTRAGYTLTGWSLTDGGSVITYPYSPVATSGITFYAIWAAISCSPTSATTGGYTIYTFTTAGTCFWTVPVGLTDVEILAVAGGGGGGYSYENSGAGGGAGGQLKTGTATLSTTLEVTVGAGGAAGISTSQRGGTGANSVVSTITALGGTGGCASRATTCSNSAQATSSAAANGGIGGAGGASGRGGGGSNTTGSTTSSTTGGVGTASSFSGTSVTYGVGGSGGTARGASTNIVGTAGSANTGNGGGGASAKSASGDVNGGVGGTGLVIVRVASALTVTFDSQSGSDVAAGSTVTGGSIATAPTDPTRANYTFLGWFTATTGGTALTFPYAHGQTANFTLYARWNLNTYAITFNTNNGTGSMGNQSFTHGVAVNLNANLYTRANYVFYRWATNADGTGTTYSNLAQVTLTAATTLYAQWTANTYVVTYNYNDATGGNSSATDSFTTGGTAIVLPTPTKTGYTFAGWYSDAGLSSSIGSAGANYSPTGATLTLNAYAKWTAVNYTFTYNSNSADEGTVPTETSKQITQTATVKANTGGLVRTGYTFGGWNTQSNGSGDNYLSGSLFTVGSSNVTLYAKWTANTYTVTYNVNSGSGNAQRTISSVATNVTSDSYTTGGSSVVLPNVGTLARSGYTFAGWNTSAAGTGTNYAAADTYTTVSNVIFYAKWNPVTYSITYNGNTSDGGSAPTTGGYTTGQASPYSVLTNTFTKTSNVFGGWNTAANGTGTSYSAGATITTLADIVLYATWIPQFTLHYAINGGSVSSGSLPADQLYNTGTSVGPVFSSVSRTGYTFGGWLNGATTIAANGNFTILADSVLTAKWTPINYTIAYNSDGGTEAPSSITKQIGQSYTVGAAVSKPGYNFTGWSNGSSVIGAGATIVTGSNDVTYTAQWVARVYTISYDWNGGRGTAVADVNYTFGTTAITLPLVGDRVRDGYTFAGWSESLGGSALASTYTPSQTRTLYALWNIGNFTVTYDAGRGTIANSTASVANGGNTILPLPTRANFTFNGWHTAVTGGSSVGSNGATFTPTSSQTVYARWIQNSLYGITDSLTRIGSVVTVANVANTFSGANSNSSVAVSIPANALPAGTTINFDLVSSSTRATGILTGVNYLVSIALSWLTGDETVPDTASDKPISVTISNATIKAGAAAYAIVNNVSTLLGTATQDGVITVSITADPEIVVAAVKPGAPTNVAATSNGNQQSVISWSAPASDGGSAITGYTVTAAPGGGTCTTSTTSCTISSLTNGTAYTFTVTATNGVGTSVASTSASATTAALYAVTFDAKSGTTVTSGSFLTASTVSEPTAPTRTGYSFAGWSATDGGSALVFPYAPGVTTAITLYARWDALDNAVTFDSKSGSDVTASVFSSGGTVAEPTAPTRSGFTFAGWSATDGGTAVTFPYAPGVVTDITLYAKWTVVSQNSSSGGGGGSSTPGTSVPSEPAVPSTPVKSNVTVVAPVTVVGDQDAKVIAVDIATPAAGSNAKPVEIKIDKASEKFIAEVKVVDGKLVLTPETGFSGKKTVTVTITENGADRIVQIPLTVLPEAVTKPVLTPTASNKSIIRWTESPNADGYTVFLNGKRVCTTTALSCSVKTILGPDANIEIVSNGGDRTVSQKVDAEFRQNVPVAITRLVSATITKATLTKVDTKALDQVVALIKNQGFGTVVISEITTTSKTKALAAARIESIKKYISSKIGKEEVEFEITPVKSRTYFNNISVKG